MLQTIRLVVKGKVQGVFYRQSAKEKAVELGITGNVKNLPDGNVEIIATGSTEQLLQLTQWCNHGPPKAVVTEIVSTPLSLQPFNNFIIIRY
jgi:acylphosphatase